MIVLIDTGLFNVFMYVVQCNGLSVIFTLFLTFLYAENKNLHNWRVSYDN